MTWQLILGVFWRGATSFEQGYPTKVSIFLLTPFEDTFHCYVNCLAVPLCVKGRGCSPFKTLTAVLPTVKISQVVMSVSNYSQFQRRMHAVLLHIGRAGSPTNGVWEISVLYPQGPVLCTRIAELAWFNRWSPWRELVSFRLQTCKTCKLIQGELDHDNRFSSPVLIYFQIKLHVSSQASLGHYWTGFELSSQAY